LGEKYVEHRDADGNETGESTERETIFGEEYTEHSDEDGNVTGK